MSKREVLTISSNLRMSGKRMIEEHVFELLGTSGNIRLIDVIEKDVIGKKTTYRHQHKKMDLETGHYITTTEWDNTQPDKFKKMIEEWCALPAVQSYKAHHGTVKLETRYLKGE